MLHVTIFCPVKERGREYTDVTGVLSRLVGLLEGHSCADGHFKAPGLYEEFH
jgi:hypothetical protein